MDSPAADPVRAAIDAVWRIEAPKVIATLARTVRDIGLAEDLAQDALVAALETWPTSGIPASPGAWLTSVGRRRAVDLVRRRALHADKEAAIIHDLQQQRGDADVDLDARLDDEVGDDMLRLILATCHPALGTEARVSLTLRLLGGLTTPEIARAFLVPEATVAQRLVRAKKTLAQAGFTLELPRGDELRARVDAVLQVVYLIFNEGYSATSGADWTRPPLCDEALRLARMLTALAPTDARVHGLLALLEIQSSRLSARVTPEGEPILLQDQDRSKWDWVRVRRGLAALDRALALAEPRERYTLQAEIAACHARARTAEETDWARIAGLYEELAAVAPSPVVQLNRAVAVSRAFGPAPALEMLDALASEAALKGYHLLHAVRAEQLERLGRAADAATEFHRAAALTQNEREQRMMLDRATALESSGR